MLRASSAVIVTLTFLSGPASADPQTREVSCALEHAASAAELLPQLLAAVDRQFTAKWLKSGSNWYTRFAVKPKPRNPFDVAAAAEPPITPHDGMVWAQAIWCQGREISAERMEIRISARVLSFHEGREWTPPLHNGVIQALTAVRVGDTWTVTDAGSEPTLFMPEATTSRPVASDVPPPSRALRLPCAATEVWGKTGCKAPAGGAAKR